MCDVADVPLFRFVRHNLKEFSGDQLEEWENTPFDTAYTGSMELMKVSLAEFPDELGEYLRGAIVSGSVKMVEYLVDEKKAELTPLLFRYATVNMEMLKYVHTKLGKVTGDNFVSAIYFAAKYDNVEAVDYIFDRFTPEEKKSISWDEFMKSAAFSGNQTLINRAIANGANKWRLALHDVICGKGNIDTVKFFLSKGAKLTFNHLTSAAYRGHEDIIDLYFTIHDHDHLKSTVIYCAHYTCHFGLVERSSILERSIGKMWETLNKLSTLNVKKE